MKRTAVLLALLAVSCARAGTDPASAPNDGSTGPDPTRVQIYAAAFRALFETERWYDPVLLDERICAGIADPMNDDASCDEMFSAAEQEAILVELADVPNVRFVDDADRVRVRIFADRTPGTGLLAVGPIERDGALVTLEANAYCGSLCAHWMTLVLEQDADGWTVTGTTGPVAIS